MFVPDWLIASACAALVLAGLLFGSALDNIFFEVLRKRDAVRAYKSCLRKLKFNDLIREVYEVKDDE